MKADGSGKKNLTNNVNRYSAPTFSPDGARVMFTEYDGNPMGDFRLHTIRTDGTGRKKFAPKVAGSMSHGVWSPNGKRVAYVGGPSGTSPLLRVIKANGDPDTIRTLASSLKAASHPDWSPNGKRLVFTRVWQTQNRRSIHQVNVDDSKVKKLAD